MLETLPVGSRKTRGTHDAVRFALALCVAPILPTLIEASLIGVYSLSILVLLGGIFLAMHLIVGAPGYLLLEEHGRAGLVAHLAAGFAAVAIPLLAVGIFCCRGCECVTQMPYDVLSFGLLGLPMGGAFWLIARPDRYGWSS